MFLWTLYSPVENIQPQTEKLNYIVISTELNTKKILVQNGLEVISIAQGYDGKLIPMEQTSNETDNNGENLTVTYHVLNENGQESTVFNSGDKFLFELIIKNTTIKIYLYCVKLVKRKQ